jgi:hypothetical protein
MCQNLSFAGAVLDLKFLITNPTWNFERLRSLIHWDICYNFYFE